MKKIEYPFTIRRLSKAEGGGWLVEFPDLPGCIADGETIEKAVQGGRFEADPQVQQLGEHGGGVAAQALRHDRQVVVRGSVTQT